MKSVFILLCFLCCNLRAGAQTFRYFIPDTISSRVVFLKVKDEEEWSKSSAGAWHWQKERQLVEHIEENVFKVAFEGSD